MQQSMFVGDGHIVWPFNCYMYRLQCSEHSPFLLLLLLLLLLPLPIPLPPLLHTVSRARSNMRLAHLCCLLVSSLGCW